MYVVKGDGETDQFISDQVTVPITQIVFTDLHHVDRSDGSWSVPRVDDTWGVLAKLTIKNCLLVYGMHGGLIIMPGRCQLYTRDSTVVGHLTATDGVFPLCKTCAARLLCLFRVSMAFSPANCIQGATASRASAGRSSAGPR